MDLVSGEPKDDRLSTKDSTFRLSNNFAGPFFGSLWPPGELNLFGAKISQIHRSYFGRPPSSQRPWAETTGSSPQRHGKNWRSAFNYDFTAFIVFFQE